MKLAQNYGSINDEKIGSESGRVGEGACARTRTSPRQALLAAFVMLLAIGLLVCASACGSTAPQAKKYEGFEPRADTEFSQYVQDAVALANERKEKADAKGSDDGLSTEASELFSKANEAYENRGEGAEAAEKAGEASGYYEQVLEESPLHLGSNVNLSLAYLSAGKTDEALKQALACLYLFPEQDGCALNVQVAGTACRFRVDDIVSGMRTLLEQVDSDDAVELMTKLDTPEMDYYDDFKYNMLWNDVETLMNSVSKGEMTIEEAYEQMLAFGLTLEGNAPSDEDARYLRAFIDALAVQYGLS